MSEWCNSLRARFLRERLYAAAPRMLTTPGCTALHVVPAKAQELTSVILLFDDQFVSIQPPILSL